MPDAGAYKRYPYAIHRMNTFQWKLAHFHVNDARFANRENNGADCRFYIGGDDLLLSAVQVPAGRTLSGKSKSEIKRDFYFTR